MPTFPLPANFFGMPSLARDERHRLRALSSDVMTDVILKSRVDNPNMHWRLAADDADVQVYEGSDPIAPPATISWCSIAHVTASLDEVVPLFNAHSTETLRDNCHILAKDEMLDCAHLLTLANTRTENISLQWHVFKSPIPGMFKPRDYVHLVAQSHFDLDGAVGYAIAWTSVRVGCCPDFRQTLGLVRTETFRAGYIFLERTDRPGSLEVTQLYQTTIAATTAPSWVVHRAIKTRLKSVRHMDRHLREKRLGASIFLTESELIPKAARAKCFLCQRKFGAFGSKHQCRKCGEVMCRGCSKAWAINLLGYKTHVTVCTTCSIAPSDLYVRSIAPSGRSSLSNFPRHRLSETVSDPQFYTTVPDVMSCGPHDSYCIAMQYESASSEPPCRLASDAHTTTVFMDDDDIAAPILVHEDFDALDAAFRATLTLHDVPRDECIVRESRRFLD
ncbi:Aste57867_1263 [Aphanomyces stellatus]|uniref:Aste57867_1263 protein n=1 Tax=Aphanomyces stellatus TaxID=120398 RepID=A0A485K5V0_9STRA|nr:hypothetical protein As57867_001262 [Aphanomyces stellatus]VFT78482.1 Aste57867_1263 [Aphanomyces stellatus]